MKISGFTFVRNAVLYDYPVRESIESLLPLCDELVVALGKSDDATGDLIASIGSPKIRVIHTIWDDSKRGGGAVLAEETNKALAECRGDWCFYLQADEVLHEGDLPVLERAISAAEATPQAEALLLQYRHFYGSYDYVGTGRQWYRREIRAFRNTGAVVSWGDAQGFRVREGGGVRKMRAILADAWVYHYGWVKDPVVQMKKQKSFNALWHDDEWIRNNVGSADAFDYGSAYEVEPFRGVHPRVMQQRIEKSRIWTSAFDPSKTKKKPTAMKILDFVEKSTGYRLGEYKNYHRIG